MQDEPAPAEILAAVARWLKEEIAPATAGHLSFQARVAANALEMARRQIDLAPEGHVAEHARLEALLGMTGDLLALNHELCRRIGAGEASLATPGVAEHLRRVTLEKLAVDQPTYASYRAELAGGKPVAAAPAEEGAVEPTGDGSRGGPSAFTADNRNGRRDMPAKSAAQQKAAGAALSAKRGDTPTSKLKVASKSMASSMSEKELETMAATKRKGKPEHTSKAK